MYRLRASFLHWGEFHFSQVPMGTVHSHFMYTCHHCPTTRDSTLEWSSQSSRILLLLLLKPYSFTAPLIQKAPKLLYNLHICQQPQCLCSTCLQMLQAGSLLHVNILLGDCPVAGRSTVFLQIWNKLKGLVPEASSHGSELSEATHLGQHYSGIRFLQL